MKKIRLGDILPHAIAIFTFLLVTLVFFKPIFFDNKNIKQTDIIQFQGLAKELTDYQEQTGETALWAGHSFSGMPAYLISMQWGYQPLSYIKKAMALGLPHPIANIFIAFLSYYILLLVFGIRPYLAIAGALAFGLSSYMIIGLSAGHNARIGAIAFIPLLLAGIHLVFTKRHVLGFGIAAVATALHLKENHLQITYYLLMMIVIYGLIQLIFAIREKSLIPFLQSTGILFTAALLGAASMTGPLWAVAEYSKYSTRGKSELTSATPNEKASSGVSKEYAFRYSNGILEPLTVLIPNFYGGSSSESFVSDEKSKTYRALVQSQNQQQANQLANYASHYWGEQPFTAPYYTGAVFLFLFVLGLIVADKKTIWWLGLISVLGIVLSWGSNFESFNYFLFDYLPGYSKFRSVTFTLVMFFFAMPLLGMLALEKLLQEKWTPLLTKKLAWSFALTGGLCFVLAVTGNIFGDYLRTAEETLPNWFTNALSADRNAAFKSDAWRSFWFIALFAAILYSTLKGWLNKSICAWALVLLTLIDLVSLDNRYFSKDNYQRARDNSFFTANEADALLLSDKTDYRVLNVDYSEARTSYYHQSLGGYHGAPLKRYDELIMAFFNQQGDKISAALQQNTGDFSALGTLNMLNTKYILLGNTRSSVVENKSIYGNAWFVKEVITVKNANEELDFTLAGDTKNTAVINSTSWNGKEIEYDSLSNVRLIERKPNQLMYESSSNAKGLVVFSEIFYPKGWVATIDGTETEILRSNYVLRALPVPAGKHTIRFEFRPASYYVGNKVSMASSWLVLLILLGSISWSLKKND